MLRKARPLKERPTTPLDPAASNILVLHSGGIDSLTPLYWLLKETTVPVQALHVIMRRRPMAEAQWARVQQQWAWLRANTRPLQSTSVEFTGKVRGLLDAEIVLAEAGKIARGRNGPRLMTGRCIEDVTSGAPGYEEFDEEFKATSNGRGYREARVLSPMRDWNKAEMAEALPPALLSLAWGCRTPVEGEACGGCPTCRRYAEAGIWERVHGKPRPLTPFEQEGRAQQQRSLQEILRKGPMAFIPAHLSPLKDALK